MKLKDGNPNLHDTARRYAGDPLREADGGALYADQEVDDALNLAYDELWRYAKAQELDWGVVHVLEDSVADQVWYSLPTTLDTQLTLVEVETTGKNLDTDSTASPTQLRKGSMSREWGQYSRGELTTTQFYVYRQSGNVLQYGLIAPPSTGGTNSIRLTHEVEQTRLVSAEQEPFIPRSHRELMCLIAAETLRISNDLDIRDVGFKMARLYPEYVEDMGPRSFQEPDAQPRAFGLTVQQESTFRHGQVTRGGK